MAEPLETDYLVIGSGIAGLNFALLAAEHGLTGDKTVRITFDPQFAQGYEWNAIGEDPELNLRFSWADCSIVK
jgi:glycine/D-amino acid oxidase-like deaminating enzyme